MQVGFLLFDRVTQLDLTGPLQVFSQAPGYECHLIAPSADARMSDGPLALVPTKTFKTAPALDMICVPGGYGVAAAMGDEALTGWLKHQAPSCRWITSVCTGAFILGAAGLLDGRKATTHWAYHDLLAGLGATPVKQRVVFDDGVVTGGGVTAGIDFALEILARESGEAVAQSIQLALEYDPSPRFSGSPDSAAPQVLSKLQAVVYDARRQVMAEAVNRAAVSR